MKNAVSDWQCHMNVLLSVILFKLDEAETEHLVLPEKLQKFSMHITQ